MHNDAPKPPTKTLLAASCVTAGTTIGIWAVTAVGCFVFSGIPYNRLPWYIGAGLAGITASSYLGTRYAVQKNRRDAWWDGFAAGDEPRAEVIQLRDVNAQGGDIRQFRTNSPS